MQQTTDSVLLVRPSCFGYNSETALSNSFQSNLSRSPEEVRVEALREFDRAADLLSCKGVNVTIVYDTPLPEKPDAIFPNNWVSFHHGGLVVLYPMHAPNRRAERRNDVIDSLKASFVISEVLDLSHYEQEGKFLEGTGSIVFDHSHQTAYASLSPRTNRELLLKLCEHLKYHPVVFTASDHSEKEIYHTNVMMAVGGRFATVCLASIPNLIERRQLEEALVNSGHEILEIAIQQMQNFAGNMLELNTGRGESVVVMSKRAYDSLTATQRQLLGRFSELIPLEIPAIETAGGGSVRCMIAEIFLPKKNSSSN